MLEGSVSPEASLLGLQVAALMLPLHVVFSVCAHILNVSLCVQNFFSYKDTGHIGLESTVMASL